MILVDQQIDRTFIKSIENILNPLLFLSNKFAQKFLLFAYLLNVAPIPGNRLKTDPVVEAKKKFYR